MVPPLWTFPPAIYFRSKPFDIVDIGARWSVWGVWDVRAFLPGVEMVRIFPQTKPSTSCVIFSKGRLFGGEEKSAGHARPALQFEFTRKNHQVVFSPIITQ